MEMNEDGSAILTVPASHPRELLPKVLSLGMDAEVLSPDSFRDAVSEVVREMASHYEPSISGQAT